MINKKQGFLLLTALPNNNFQLKIDCLICFRKMHATEKEAETTNKSLSHAPSPPSSPGIDNRYILHV